MQTVVRKAEVADAAAIARVYAPIVENSAISFEETAPSADEMARRIEATLKTHPYLAAERAGRVVGYAYASEHRARPAYRWSADVTVYVDEAARAMGVGKALYSHLLSALAAHGFHAAFAGIALPNQASVALHEAMGFTPVGIYRQVGFKFGQWRDVGWWQRLLEDRPRSGSA